MVDVGVLLTRRGSSPAAATAAGQKPSSASAKKAASVPLMALHPDWVPRRTEDGTILPEGRLWEFVERLSRFRREGKKCVLFLRPLPRPGLLELPRTLTLPSPCAQPTRQQDWCVDGFTLPASLELAADLPLSPSLAVSTRVFAHCSTIAPQVRPSSSAPLPDISAHLLTSSLPQVVEYSGFQRDKPSSDFWAEKRQANL